MEQPVESFKKFKATESLPILRPYFRFKKKKKKKDFSENPVNLGVAI